MPRMVYRTPDPPLRPPRAPRLRERVDLVTYGFMGTLLALHGALLAWLIR